MPKKTIRSHTPEEGLTPATWAARPTEKGLVMAAEKPKQAASRHAPRPAIVSIPTESKNIVTMGSRVISSSYIPKKLPKSIKISTVRQTTGLPLLCIRCISLPINIFIPPVFSRILNIP